MTPGLANRLSYGAAAKICCNFPETLSLLPKDKAVLTGSPIRAELLSGSRERGRSLTGFPEEKPVLLVIGGSLGSRAPFPNCWNTFPSCISAERETATPPSTARRAIFSTSTCQTTSRISLRSRIS